MVATCIQCNSDSGWSILNVWSIMSYNIQWHIVTTKHNFKCVWLLLTNVCKRKRKDGEINGPIIGSNLDSDCTHTVGKCWGHLNHGLVECWDCHGWWLPNMVPFDGQLYLGWCPWLITWNLCNVLKGSLVKSHITLSSSKWLHAVSLYIYIQGIKDCFHQ